MYQKDFIQIGNFSDLNKTAARFGDYTPPDSPTRSANIGQSPTKWGATKEFYHD